LAASLTCVPGRTRNFERFFCSKVLKSGVYKDVGVHLMNKTLKILLLSAAAGAAVLPLFSQTASSPKPSFEVISIKPSAPLGGGGPIRIGGGTRGDRYTMNAATLRMLLQQAYSKPGNAGPGSQVQLIGGPGWMDSDRYDIQATANCSGGVLSREQVQLMIQSMLEDRFQLKVHRETRELPIYNLIVGKDGPKIQASADQTPPAQAAGGPPQPCSPPSATPTPAQPPPPPPVPPGQRGGTFPELNPNFAIPRGGTVIMFGPNGFAIRGSAVPITNLVGNLQQQTGRPVVDKTGLKGLYDFILQFSPEGLNGQALPGLPLPPAPPGTIVGGPGAAGAGAAGPGAATAAAAEPVPSLFTAIQELGLRLESAKGPVEVLVIDSAQKPPEN
jgi:uncharacterized protein (TIGR03435 family)